MVEVEKTADASQITRVSFFFFFFLWKIRAARM